MSSESFNKCLFEALKSSLADTAVREERALVLNFAHQCCRRGEFSDARKRLRETNDCGGCSITMSNNYLQFSFEVPLNTPEEKEWLETFLDTRPEGFWTKDQIADEPDVEERLPDFEWQFGDGAIIFYAEENGDTEQMTQVLQEFLLKSDTALKAIGFSYSFTSSAMRPGEFGGGAIVVTRATANYDNHFGKIPSTKVEYIDSLEWLIKKLS